MKKTISFLTFIIILSAALFIQSCGTVKQSNPLIGKTSFEVWKNSKYWNQAAYVDYDPNTQRTFVFNKFYKADKFNIIIFASIYCDECLLNVPQLARIVESARFPEESIKFYGLDEYSAEPTGYYKKFKIEKTPAVFLEFTDGTILSIPKGKDWLESMHQFLYNRAEEKRLKNENQK